MAIVEGRPGPLIDGRRYHAPGFAEALEEYHTQAVAAHTRHAGIGQLLPELPELPELPSPPAADPEAELVAAGPVIDGESAAGPVIDGESAPGPARRPAPRRSPRNGARKDSA